MVAPERVARPQSTQDLSPAERRLVGELQQLGFGRVETIRIKGGQLVLDPWPTVVRSVKFCTPAHSPPADGSEEFEIKKQLAELFAYVRGIDNGVIRVLEVRGGLPFSMEIERCIPRASPPETTTSKPHRRDDSFMRDSMQRNGKHIL
jgi:hypothetical protein